MLVFIYLCILLLNLVAITLTYHCLGKNMDKKEKGIFIIVGIAIMYMLVTFVYWISSKNINLEVESDIGKNLITFTFVPVNAIIVLPFLANSYKHWKDGKVKSQQFRNRCILISVVLIIALVIEFFYFQNIQNGILAILNSNK